MKHFFRQFKAPLFILCIALFASCESENTETDNVEDLLVTTSTCTDGEITDFLNTCKWSIVNSSDASLDNFKIDFSGENIHVYNKDNAVIDEGYWELEKGILTFHNLSAALANYVGDWAISECREGFLELKRGEEVVHLEKDCEETTTTESSAACTDGEIAGFLDSCRWSIANSSDASLDNFIIDFSGMNIHVYDKDNTLIDEGYWELENGILTFQNLSAALANYLGDWAVSECREGFLELKRGEEVVHLEKDCNE